MESKSERCTPECSGSRRTINRVPEGSPFASISDVSSATAAPIRSSPLWVSASSHTPISPSASKVALVTWGFDEAETKNLSVPFPARLQELKGAPSGVRPHDDFTLDEFGIIANAVSV